VISIYSVRVLSLVRSKVSIKLILFFLKFKLESNSKSENFHYLEGKDYLENKDHFESKDYLKDKDRMTKAHYSP